MEALCINSQPGGGDANRNFPGFICQFFPFVHNSRPGGGGGGGVDVLPRLELTDDRRNKASCFMNSTQLLISNLRIRPLFRTPKQEIVIAMLTLKTCQTKKTLSLLSGALLRALLFAIGGAIAPPSAPLEPPLQATLTYRQRRQLLYNYGGSVSRLRCS